MFKRLRSRLPQELSTGSFWGWNGPVMPLILVVLVVPTVLAVNLASKFYISELPAGFLVSILLLLGFCLWLAKKLRGHK